MSYSARGIETKKIYQQYESKHMLNFLGKKEIFEKQLASQKINKSFDKIVSVNANGRD